MNVDFHVHTNRSVDAVHSPRQMVKWAKHLGLHAIAITDHERLFPWIEAKRLTREFGVVVIPGLEGGNIAVEKHWIALGISRQLRGESIAKVLTGIREEGGVSIAPHPHSRLGYPAYADLGFDAVESLNGSEPASNVQVRNARGLPEVAGSDAHSLPMLGHCWTHIEAGQTVEDILEAVRKGLCVPKGTTIPFLDYLRFYPLYFKNRILHQPSVAYAALRKEIHNIRAVRLQESKGSGKPSMSGMW
jgi:predicted metal-dependent phosphoesterase TrpH